jgi:phage FluMu gp28-like protein
VEDWLLVNVQPLLDKLSTLRSYYGQDFARSRRLVGDLADGGDAFLRGGPFLIEMRNVPFDQQRQCCSTWWTCRISWPAPTMCPRNGQWLAEVAAVAAAPISTGSC